MTKSSSVPVSFFIPRDQWPPDIDPENPEYAWSGDRLGKWNWTIQTWQHLNRAGFSCRLTGDLPETGIVLAHRQVLPDTLRPGPHQLIVCILAERDWHPYAQVHLLQNPGQHVRYSRSIAGRLDRWLMKHPSTAFIRYWPQPDLVPRDPARADRFENIVFKGIAANVAPELTEASFRNTLTRMGLTWVVDTDKSAWPDYSSADAVLAVRSFGPDRFDRKPATKLYNAWLAGVPAILGAESAYRHEGHPGIDYLEARSVTDLVDHLQTLKQSPDLRHDLVTRGAIRAQALTIPRLADEWVRVITGWLIPAYRHWLTSSSTHRSCFISLRHAVRLGRLLRKKIRHRAEMLTGKR